MRTIFDMKCALTTVGLASLLLTGCNNQRMATIEGNITGAEGKLLVLEHLTDGAPHFVDTVRLDAAGKFKFTTEAEQGPDFFSLRLDNQSISLVIDTLLTPVQISADAANLLAGYEVSGEENKELKEAIQCGNRLRGQILNVNKSFNEQGMDRQVARDSIMTLVNNYKTQVLQTYIYKNPSSPASYYLMFETVSGLVIFDANNAEDLRAFGAVATGWQFNYPASPRNKVLSKMTLEGQRNRALARAKAQMADSVAKNTVIETRTFPELKLNNVDDHAVSLTEVVAEGKATIVDFTAYYMDYSPAHNMALSSIYEKYADKGLKIYQVCLDFDEHFWKTSAGNLPWTAVRDQSVIFDQQGSIQYSAAALTYNVASLPTAFVIDGEGNIQARIDQNNDDLEAVVKKILK